MAPKMSSRRSAAESLLQQMGGGTPLPEEDEMAPGPEEAMPPMPEEGMMPPMPEGGGEMPPPEEGQGMDFESALAGLEASLHGMPEDAAKEIRTHLEAIRDIASGGGAGMAPEGEELPPAPESTTPPEAPDAGLEKLPL